MGRAIEETLKRAKNYCVNLACYKTSEDEAIKITLRLDEFKDIEAPILKWYIEQTDRIEVKKSVIKTLKETLKEGACD